ncbi:MAG: DUF3237 domain-containing protein [Bacteroidetes bacterium]|nr:DUF3237 domain-containing protein [Bacteroidota bacterium]
MNTEINETEKLTTVNYIFDETIYLTGITDFGISWEDMLAGKDRVPPHGARYIITFEGRITGEKINGAIKGTDYLLVRADKQFILNIQASILTDDGEMIFLEEDGILTPNNDGTAQLHLNMHFSTASKKYDWLNKKQVWGIGEVDMKKGEIKVKGYSN